MHVLKVCKTQSGAACFVCACGKAIATTRIDWLENPTLRDEIWMRVLAQHRKHRGDCLDVRYPMMYPVWERDGHPALRRSTIDPDDPAD